MRRIACDLQRPTKRHRGATTMFRRSIQIENLMAFNSKKMKTLRKNPGHRKFPTLSKIQRISKKKLGKFPTLRKIQSFEKKTWKISDT